MKTKRWFRMAVLAAALILCCTSCKKDSTEGADTENDYTLFKRVESLLSSTCNMFPEEGADENTSFYEYTGAGETIRVEEIYYFYKDPYLTKYTIYHNDEEVNTFLKSVDYKKSYRFHYTDVNQDGYNDVVIIGYSPMGSYAGTEWIYVYDIRNNEVVQLFDDTESSGSHFTQRQQEQLEAMLGDEFHETFPECEEIYYDAAGNLYVDSAGNIYYKFPVLKPKYWNLDGHLGMMIAFFSYDKNSGELNVADCIYMPEK